MARTSPFHAQDATVYHNNTRCEDGKQVKPQDRRHGPGGLKLCQTCAFLNATNR
jgi:hypothetical protein